MPTAKRRTDKPASLEQLLAAKEIVISCGSGGGGKTTTAAAAAAMAAVHQGGKVLVLTVDPARRLADFFSSRLLRVLTVPYRSRLVNMASRPFYQVADRILGSQFLQDIAEFFLLFQTMYDGFVERAEAVTRLLHDKRTTFVVVSTLEAAPLREAEFFIDALGEKRFHMGAVALNKVLPGYLLDEETTAVAERLRARA